MSTQQFGELQRKNMDVVMKLAQLSLENSQRIVELQVSLTKKLVQDCIENTQSLAAVRDPQKVIALQTRYAQESTQTMMDAARQIAECGNASCAEFVKLFSEQFSNGNNEMLSSVQSLFSAWPGHNNTAEALNQAMSAMTQAFGQFTQASATTFAPPEKTPEAASSNGAAGTRRRSTR